MSPAVPGHRTSKSAARLAELNPPQHKAVVTENGPLLVLAGAGTGKTRVVTYRIAHLIDQGIAPERILAVTFTNKAAGEMQHRITELLGKRRKQKPEISTFHAFCARVLRRQGVRLGLRKNYTIYAGSQGETLARRVLAEVDVSGIKMKPSELVQRIGQWKNRSISPGKASALIENDKDHLAVAAYRRYQNTMRNLGAVDFDDLLLLTEELFRKHPAARREEAGRLDHILVDEYQDTNASQYRIIKTLAAGHRNLCVVGDDDQSIYGWRGADVKHILSFQRDWPEAKVVRLEENYRSTGEILRLANRLISCNTNRHAKKLKPHRGTGLRPRVLACADEVQEAQMVIEDVRQKIKHDHYQPGDIAVLFRTNEQTRPIESELRRWKIPYVVLGGLSFFDRREVRDTLAYLKLLDDPRDDPSLLRIVNFPARGISDNAIGKISRLAMDTDQSCWDVMSHGNLPGVTPAAAQAMQDFVALTERFRGRLKTTPAGELARQFLDAMDYSAALRRAYPDPLDNQARWNSVREVVVGLEEFASQGSQKKSKTVLSDYLNDIALRGNDFANDKESKLQQNAVGLLTLHAAKGLEFPVAYLVGLEEGLLPHYRSVEMGDDAIDEERRLCYVGVTRAEEHLMLTFAKTRRKRGKPKPCQPSRFLSEMVGRPIATPKSGGKRASPRRRSMP
jgi:DNA helicase-2/ATP-dependent DNA helicase PcrA